MDSLKPLFLISLVACAPELYTDERYDNDVDLVGGADEIQCVFSFDCADNQVCSEEGRCIEAPATCNEFETGAGTNGEASTSAPAASADQLPDTAENRALFAQRLLAGMETLQATAETDAALTTAFGSDYKKIEAVGAASPSTGPLYDAVIAAWADHVSVRELIVDPARGDELLRRVQTLGRIHEAKTSIKPWLENLSAYMRSLADASNAASADGGCEGVLSALMDPEARERTSYELARAGLVCRDRVRSIIATLRAAAQTSPTVMQPIPVQQLTTTDERVFNFFGEGFNFVLYGDMDEATRQRALAQQFSNCASFVRAKELVSAVFLYGNAAQSSLRNMVNAFPITDLYIDLSWWPFTADYFGAFARSATTVDAARNALAAALAKQNQHIAELVSDRPTDPRELALITLLSDTFLGQPGNRQFSNIHARLLAEANAGISFYALAATAVGCAAGAIGATIWSGPWAAAAGALAFVACSVGALISYEEYKRTSHLYHQAQTFRYFGFRSSLETWQRVEELQSSANWQLAFLVIDLVGFGLDVGALTQSFRQILRSLRVGRGLRGFPTSGACFVAGTHVRVAGGTVQIETLRRGDLVISRPKPSKSHKPIGTPPATPARIDE